MSAAHPVGSGAQKRNALPNAAAYLWQPLTLAAFVLLLYTPVLSLLVRDWWSDPNYSHGFFVPLLSGYVIWNRRGELSQVVPRPSWLGLPVVLVSIAVMFAASLGAELFLARVSLLGVILGLVIYIRGWWTLRVLAFPLAFLVFMIPLPAIVYNQLVFPLQLLASKLAAFCLQVTQFVPVAREGNVLILPSGSLEVVEACSGIRSLMSLVTLAAAYSFFVEKNNWIRILLVASMIPVAVISNATRVVTSAVMSELWGPAATEGTAHALSGVVLFSVSVGCLLLLHGGLRLLFGLRGPARENA